MKISRAKLEEFVKEAVLKELELPGGWSVGKKKDPVPNAGALQHAIWHGDYDVKGAVQFIKQASWKHVGSTMVNGIRHPVFQYGRKRRISLDVSRDKPWVRQISNKAEVKPLQPV